MFYSKIFKKVYSETKKKFSVGSRIQRNGMIQYNFDANQIGSISNPNFISLQVDLIQMYLDDSIGQGLQAIKPHR